MIRNILLVTWRNLVRHKVYSSINILGLALGIAAFLLLGAYVAFENSYDQEPADAQHIYRVESQFYKGNELTDDWATSTNGYARAMYENLPGIASYTRIDWHSSERVVRYQDIKFREERVAMADSNFLTFFGYPMLQGDAATALQGVNSLVISESAARKYFGAADPMGKILEVSTQSHIYPCIVKGVFKDLPKNSTLQVNFLISWATSSKWTREFWYQHGSYTYLKLQPGTNAAVVESGFPALAERYKTGPALKDLKWGVHLVPLQDIHLNAAKLYEIEPKGNRFFVGFLSVIAYVILLIAYINYINLATTKSLDRAKEVGIRKVSGAPVAQLVFQFLLESILLNGLALVMAIGLVLASLSWLPGFLNANELGGLLFNTAIIGRTALVFVVCTLLSGIYPAMVLVKLKPISVLKGKFSFSKKGILLRKGMVAFQFVASILLIAGTIAVYRQVDYMTSQQTGVNIDQTIVIKTPVKTANYKEKFGSLREALRSTAGVQAVTASGAVPGKAVGMSLANRRFGASAAEERTYEMLKVDHEFISLYGLQLVAGRAFDKARPADSTGLVMNESAVKQFGFASPEAAIGQKVWLETLTEKPNEVIGVIKDYHQQSLQQSFTPFILFMDRKLDWIPFEHFSVKVNATNMRDKVASLEKTWNQFFPESSFDYFFLDDFYGRQYQQELHFSRNFLVFSSLAIFITCLGLLGLTAYATARRIKEIGIRKVLGASVQNIVLLLSADVIRLILVCSLIALPAAWLLIGKWIEGYAFRASLTWWQFVLPVLVLVVIALVTTASLTVKAALANPTKSLRDE
ncbi:ABC transporter permease [Paraflavitalea sp. CAU 1676]|uniref:ABC transporter permease n=1 Tax=Paraflavitalea sp. CAU 1676 TaxID=3032598 RepID=UPI0023DAB98A|nr:ABC transporter permease [Paraflavitalea sp. CAU 1676]MDF2187880.1 ABC transporter permease [Paraflavitalea sp. CAU 1676]